MYTLSKYFIGVTLFVAVLYGCMAGSVLSVSAQATNPTGGSSETVNTTPNPTGGSNETVNTAPSVSIDFQISNPLKAKSLQCLIYDIVNGLMEFLAVVAALYIIYSGFQLVAAQGNPAKITSAKRSFMNALIGTAILLGAWAITSFLVNTINEIVTVKIPGLPTSSSCSS